MEVCHTEEAQLERISSSSGSSKATKASPQQEAEAHLAPLESHQQVCQFRNTSNRQANTKTKLSSPVPSISNRALRLWTSLVLSREPSRPYRGLKIREEALLGLSAKVWASLQAKSQHTNTRTSLDKPEETVLEAILVMSHIPIGRQFWVAKVIFSAKINLGKQVTRI